MTETYYPLGHATAWIVAIPPVVIFACAAFANRRNPKFKLTWLHWSVAGFFAIVGGLGLPMELSMAVACLVGVVLALNGRLLKTVQITARIGIAVVPLILAGVFFKETSMVATELTLTPDKVVFTDFEGTHSVPRQGLRVDEITNPPSWSSNRGWGSWTTFSGKNLGPDLTGTTWYWGPHGVMLGDAVGQRLAEWAGVKPSVQPMMSDREINNLKNKIEQEYRGPKNGQPDSDRLTPATGTTTEKL